MAEYYSIHTYAETVAWPRKDGPLAQLNKMWHYRGLLWQMVLRNVKARYTQSILGIFWAVLNPVLMALVLSVAFSIFIRIPTNDTPYVLFVLCGLLPWNFFVRAITDATQSLVSHPSLITKVPFPREILPASHVMSRLIDFLLSAVVLLVLLPLFGHAIHLTTLWVPVLLLIQIIFILALSFFTSMTNLFFRDVSQLVNIGLVLWMYLTPVIYPIDLVPEQYQSLYLLNPMASIVTSYRRVILNGISPEWNNLAYPIAISFIMLAVSYFLFKKKEPLFAERV